MIRVLLADDQGLVRAGFRALIDAEDGMEVVGEAADGAEAVREAKTLVPDVVLMDIRMPVLDGLAATREIASDARLGGVRVLILTTFDLDDYVFEALRSGASGFLVKDTPPGEIINAIRLVASGDAIISPSVTRALLSHFGDLDASARHLAAAQRLATLTERELEVATAIGTGASNADVAASLYMSEATVKAHVTRLLTKLGASNRVQIAIAVHDAGLA